MSSETIISGADGSEIVVRSLLPGIQRYPLQVRRQDRDHPKLPREGIHLHEAELPAVLRALAMPDQRIPILLTREEIDALLQTIQRDLRAQHNWIIDIAGAGPEHKAAINARIDTLAAIAAQLRAQGEGE